MPGPDHLADHFPPTIQNNWRLAHGYSPTAVSSCQWQTSSQLANHLPLKLSLLTYGSTYSALHLSAIYLVGTASPHNLLPNRSQQKRKRRKEPLLTCTINNVSLNSI